MFVKLAESNGWQCPNVPQFRITSVIHILHTWSNGSNHFIEMDKTGEVQILTGPHGVAISSWCLGVRFGSGVFMLSFGKASASSDWERRTLDGQGEKKENYMWRFRNICYVWKCAGPSWVC